MQEIEDGDRLTFRSKRNGVIRTVDSFNVVLPAQGPEIEYLTPAGAHYFERVHHYFSKNAPAIGETGDDVELFKDVRTNKTYAVISNTDNQVFQIFRLVNLRPDERSRMQSEFTFDKLEDIFSLAGEDVLQLPFALKWVKCWGINEDLPTEFDWEALPEVKAGDGASVLAVLDKVGGLK